MGSELNRYLLKGYVGHKSNRKKNCREATAYIGYKSQYQFLCGIQRSISIQVLKQKQNFKEHVYYMEKDKKTFKMHLSLCN